MGDLDDGDYPEFIIKLDLLARALKCKPNEVEARLMVKLPLKADIKAKEKEINQIQIEQTIFGCNTLLGQRVARKQKP